MTIVYRPPAATVTVMAGDGTPILLTQDPPEQMQPHQRSQVRAAAFRVTKIHPGPVGELIQRELLSWEEFGFVLGDQSLVRRVVDEIMRTELP